MMGNRPASQPTLAVRSAASGRSNRLANCLAALFLPCLLTILGLVAAHATAAPLADYVGINGAPCSYATIGDALGDAVEGDTIYISPGVYNEVLGTINLDLHFTGATADCTAADPTAPYGDFWIDGGGASTFHGGIANIAAGHMVTFTRVLLYRAEAIRGGLVYVESGATAIFDTVGLTTGHADDVGGLIAVAPGGSLYIGGDSYLTTGDAGNAGGALHLQGYAELDDVHIRNNNALQGGAIAVTGSGHLVLHSSGLGTSSHPNIAQHGGGLHATGSAHVEISGSSTFASNEATVGRGGGLYADGPVMIELRDSARMWANEATGEGGAIYAANGASLSLTGNATIGGDDLTLANRAAHGAGIFVDGASSFTIDDQVSVGNNIATGHGGGVYLGGGAILDMSGGAVSQNQAGGNGGGIMVATGEVALEDAVISHNSALFGGGIALTGLVNNPLSAINTQIISNTAGSLGGGIMSSNSTVTLTDTDGSSLLSYNESGQDGGGVYFVASEQLNLIAATPGSGWRIEHNSAVQFGGALYVENGVAQLSNSRLHFNEAGAAGGALFLSGAEAMISEDAAACNSSALPADTYCSELRGNSAPSGGALYTENSARLSVENSALIANISPQGSALAAFGAGDILEITNSLLAQNSGKALYAGAAVFLDLVHSTLAGNEWAVDVDDNGATASFSNNIIWDNGFGVESEAPLGGDCSFSQNGTGGALVDPLLATTPRGDYRLQPGSPAADACAAGVGRDLDGVPRPQGAQYDSGAFELLPTLSIAPAAIAEGDAGVTSLALTVTLNGPSSSPVSVDFATSDLSATAGEDYLAQSGTLTILPGEVSGEIVISILGDQLDESDETFAVTLGNPSNALIAPGAAVAQATVVDDDTAPALDVFLPTYFR